MTRIWIARLELITRLAVTCPLIEEKHLQENYILYVCKCSDNNPAKREDCPFYTALQEETDEETDSGD